MGKIYCVKCKEEIIELPHRCRFCNKFYCSSCRLPETHKCKEFKEENERRSKAWADRAKRLLLEKDKIKERDEIDDIVGEYTLEEKPKKEKQNKKSFWQRIKKFFEEYGW